MTDRDTRDDDRDKAHRTPEDAAKTPRGTFGDARPDEGDHDDRTRGGQPQEKVEDRDAASQVKPEDYPLSERKAGDVTGAS